MIFRLFSDTLLFRCRALIDQFGIILKDPLYYWYWPKFLFNFYM